MTIRSFVLVLAVWSFIPQGANGSDVRRTKFPDGLWGTWALSQDTCQGKDDTSISISETQFTNSEDKCDVLWIIELSAGHGVTYGAHARCVDSKQPVNARAVDLIFWPQDRGRILIGKAFNNLKTYQRCP
jgi:hypothetical protein